MLTRLRLENFKSWQDTQDIALRPITGFFGANSSGKSSLMQALLLLKQTADSADRGIVFHFGALPSTAYVDLGNFATVVHGHDMKRTLGISLDWQSVRPVGIRDTHARKDVVSSKDIGFRVFSRMEGDDERAQLILENMSYSLGDAEFGLRRVDDGKYRYDLFAKNVSFRFVRNRGHPWKFTSPVKCFGFPEKVRSYYQNAGFLSNLEFALEHCLRRLHYLGPLRAFPERIYSWHGSQPSDVGKDGRLAVDALLESRRQGRWIRGDKGKKRQSLEEYVAMWLKKLDLIYDFSIHQIIEGGGLYRVNVRKARNAPDVSITDVGFGVSQILPALVLCFYVPERSTVILEQPDIHLHPSVQAGLADVFIDAWRKRKVQVIVESHSEHLLRRLQRRIAEEAISQDDIGLYFCKEDDGASSLDTLEVDQFGNISNWPQDFFGDQFGEIAAMSEAALKRRQAAG